MSTTFDLPRTISVNALWRIAGKRLIKSDQYKAWLEECGWEVLRQRVKPVKGNYRLQIEALNDGKRRRDIDNIIKATSDLLVHMRLIEDDSLCDQVICSWVDGGPPLRVTITPTKE